MVRDMNRNRVYFKYLTLIGMIYDLLSPDFKVSLPLIIGILIYIVIVQVRMYHSKYESIDVLTRFTLPMDLVLMALAIFFGYGIPVCFLLIICFDSIMYLKKYKYMPVVLAHLLYLYSMREAIVNTIPNLLLTLIFICIINILKDERRQRIDYLNDNYRLNESNQKLTNELERVESSMNTIKELYTTIERNRISRELHDSIGHSLSTIVINLRAIEKMSRDDSEKAGEMASTLTEFSKDALLKLRQTLSELKPSEISAKSIQIAIEELINNFSELSAIHVNFGVSKNLWELGEHRELVIYRIVQEFLSNSAKHGKPKSINIFMNYGQTELILTLKDDGVGTDEINENIGLKGIRERIIEVGGNIQYSSTIGDGFFMRVVLPRFKKEHSSE